MVWTVTWHHCQSVKHSNKVLIENMTSVCRKLQSLKPQKIKEVKFKNKNKRRMEEIVFYHFHTDGSASTVVGFPFGHMQSYFSIVGWFYLNLMERLMCTRILWGRFLSTNKLSMYGMFLERKIIWANRKMFYKQLRSTSKRMALRLLKDS